MLATHPAANQGFECNTQDPACGVPRNTVLQIRLDRFLDPATAIRQSVRINRGNDATNAFAQPEYDVVERVLIYRPLGELQPKATYTVEILIPSEDDPDGLRAFDGAPLEEGPVPLRFDFHTNGEPSPPPSLPPEPVPTCEDVSFAVFSNTGGCANEACHVRNDPPPGTCPPYYGRDDDGRCVQVPRMGLLLADAPGLLTTAIGKVAHQTEVGSKGGVTLENSPRFGVQMPIIDPERPDNSYLLYKLLRNPDNYDNDEDVSNIDQPCASRYTELGPPDACAAPADDERTRMREWFVRGDPMPAKGHISRSNLRKIQAWIRGGASCKLP